jgi:hypothetical protein
MHVHGSQNPACRGCESKIFFRQRLRPEVRRPAAFLAMFVAVAGLRGRREVSEPAPRVCPTVAHARPMCRQWANTLRVDGLNLNADSND